LGNKIRKSFRKVWRISREIRGNVFAGFSGFSGVGVIFGTMVMARRTGRWDRGVREIPGVVADRGVGVARVGDGPGAGGAGGIRGTRAEGERERPGFRKKGRAQRENFENTRDLLGDLLGAKNAGVTDLPHLK
jgi:hypothetical protein